MSQKKEGLLILLRNPLPILIQKGGTMSTDNIETDHFVIDQIEWDYQQPEIVTGNPWRLEPACTGVRGARVMCKNCNYTWLATVGDGNFFRSIRGKSRLAARIRNVMQRAACRFPT
jgi:hypothetical protein